MLLDIETNEQFLITMKGGHIKYPSHIFCLDRFNYSTCFKLMGHHGLNYFFIFFADAGFR